MISLPALLCPHHQGELLCISMATLPFVAMSKSPLQGPVVLFSLPQGQFPTGPALLCWPGELQGPLSLVLQLHREVNLPTFMTTWTALPPATVCEGFGEECISFLHPPP